MSPQEIGLIVVLVVVAGYVIAALLSRSKSGEEQADIILEARLPQTAASEELLNPGSDKTSRRKTKNRRRKKSDLTAEIPRSREDLIEKRIQKHHASPKAPPKPKAEPRSKQSASAKPAQDVTASAKPKPKPVADPVPVIDPKLTGKISELDDRLDAIERLVATIEESLATFGESESESALKPGEAQAA